jgi:hypothetical protein
MLFAYVTHADDLSNLSVGTGVAGPTQVLAALRYVLLDEVHVYGGRFGSHVALVVRRLRRLCALYGNNTVRFICCSATIGASFPHVPPGPEACIAPYSLHAVQVPKKGLCLSSLFGVRSSHGGVRAERSCVWARGWQAIRRRM